MANNTCYNGGTQEQDQHRTDMELRSSSPNDMQLKLRAFKTVSKASVAPCPEEPTPEQPGYDSFLKAKLHREHMNRLPVSLIKMPEDDKEEDELRKVGTIEYKNPIELLDSESPTFCFSLKYIAVAVRYYVCSICAKVIQHPLFDNITLLIILANCVTLAMDDPTTDVQETWQVNSDYTFQALYTAELMLKVMAMGFLFNEGAYLRDPWNVLDFIIVVFGYLGYLNVKSGGFDLKTLRIFRVLRPLRTVTNIEGLRILMSALADSVLPLLDSLVVLVFALAIFAIAGLQVWHGQLKYRCLNISTGDLRTDLVCGSAACPNGYTCVNYGLNPNYGVTNFDNFYNSMMLVFVVITLEGWTDIQIMMIKAFGYTAPIYFNLLMLIGAYFLFNFTLAVIKTRVSDTYEENRRKKLEHKMLPSSSAKVGMDKFRRSVFGRMSNIKSSQERSRAPISFVARDPSLASKMSRASTTPNNSNPMHTFRQMMGMDELMSDCCDDPEVQKQATAKERDGLIVVDDGSPAGSRNGQSPKLFTKVSGRFACNFKNALRLGPFHKSAKKGQELPDLDEFIDTILDHSSGSPSLSRDDPGATIEDYGDFDQEWDEDRSYPQAIPAGTCDRMLNADSSSSMDYSSRDLKNSSSRLIKSPSHDNVTKPEENKTQLPMKFFKVDPPETNIANAGNSNSINANPTFEQKPSVPEPVAEEKEEEEQDVNIEDRPDEDEDAAAKKYVLKEGDFGLTSEVDVLLPHGLTALWKQPLIVAADIAPYRMKVVYSPTELPQVEETAEEGNNKKKTVRKPPTASRVDELARSGTVKSGDSRSVVSSADGRSLKRSATRGSKGKKKKKGSSRGSSKDDKNKLNAKSVAGSKDMISDFGGTSQDPELRSATSGRSGSNHPTNRGKGGPNAGDDEEEEVVILPVPKVLEQLKSESGPHLSVQWSGQEVEQKMDPYIAVWVTERLSEIKVWKIGMKGTIAWFRHTLKMIMLSDITNGFLTLCVLANTVVLALNRYGMSTSESNTLDNINTMFTGIFIAEMALKLMGVGIVGYLSDAMNYVDGIVVIFSVIELIFLNSSGSSGVFRAFQAFRIVRTFRVVRMVRLLRALRSMRLLIQVIGDTIASFAYIGMLLLIFIFIYSLVGMQLFGGRFNFQADGKPRQNFDSFNRAFLSIYQVLTIENWQSLLYSSMRAQIPALVALFYVSWLFIGNYVLLNLLLALMLDAFADEEEDNEEDESTTESETHELRSTSAPSGYAKETNSKTGSIMSRTMRSKFSTEEQRDDMEFADSLLMPKKKKHKAPLTDTECNYSLYIFSKENPIRIFLWRLVSSKRFEWGIILLISISAILLAAGTFYLSTPDPSVTDIMDYINDVLIFCFGIEAVLKIIAYGFLVDSGSYLRSTWNIMDFAIVIASFIDFAMSSVNIPMIRVLRLLRTFRPLRFVSNNIHMKIIVKALFKSMGALCNTMVLILVVYVMFSIVGVSFFAGKFQYCTVDIYNNSNQSNCNQNGGNWYTYDLNFDNVINGLIQLFELTTQENWPITVYQAVDCTDVDSAGWYYAYYYVVFLFIGSMFMLNLFVGVMFHNFTKVQEQETQTFGGVVATEQQLNWIEVQKLITRAEPNYNARTAPSKTSWRAGVHSFITSTYFEIFISVIILLNMLQMALLYDNESDAYAQGLDIVNYIFTGVFTAEIILKLIGYGMNFWYETWNLFDFVIVVCSYIDIVFTNIASQSLRMLRIGPQLLRVLRVFRVARLMRLVKKYRRLQEIMEIIQLCLPSIMNVLALLMLIMFIYAILGCYLFYDVTNGNAINSVYNFSNFGLAFMLCLKMSTGEDWNIFMFDCARTSYTCAAGLGCGKYYAYAYFISFKIVVTFIMLNLFVLVVLQLFEKYFIESENIVSTFKEDFELFQEKWQMAHPSHSGFFMNVDKLCKFFNSLPSRFYHEENDPNRLSKYILSLGIRWNIFFNELLYCALRPLYVKRMRSNDMVSKKEKMARKCILRAAEREAKRSYYSTTRANPFLSLMTMRMTLKMWRNYKDNHKKRVDEHQKRGEMNYDSSLDQSPSDYIPAPVLPARSDVPSSVDGLREAQTDSRNQQVEAKLKAIVKSSEGATVDVPRGLQQPAT